MKFVYRVESDVPLAIFSGVGNTPVVRPTEHGYNTVTEIGKPQTVRNGPQGIPSTLTLELCRVGTDIMDRTQEQLAPHGPRAERLLALIEAGDAEDDPRPGHDWNPREGYANYGQPAPQSQVVEPVDGEL